MRIFSSIIIAFIFIGSSFADTVCVIYSGKNKFSGAIAKKVTKDLEEKGFNIIDCSYNNKVEYKALTRKIDSVLPDYLLSFGKSATKLAASMNISGVFAMSMNSYALGLYDNDLNPLKRMTGILMNVAPSIQLDLLQRVMALPNGIGIIYNPDNYQFLVDSYSKECSKRNIPLKVVKCMDAKKILAAYKEEKGSSDCFVSMLDTSIYTMKNVFEILQFVSKNKIPYVGVSSQMVKKGALIATFPDPADIHTQIVKIFAKLKDGVSVKNIKVEYPSKLDFCINKKMEKNYKVTFSEEIIEEALAVVD